MQLGPREQELWNAQQRAKSLFAQVIESGMVRPGILESELSESIHTLAKDRYGVKRHWHRRIVRSGPNTCRLYQERAPDRRLLDDDILFLDFGPVFSGWEADLGRTYVLGTDAEKLRLADDVLRAFARGKAFYEANPDCTAGLLYDFVVGMADEYGWRFGSATAGHPVDAFPRPREHDAIALRARQRSTKTLDPGDPFRPSSHAVRSLLRGVADDFRPGIGRSPPARASDLRP
jgi:Xaa-Pro dipeptidase